MTKYKQGDKVRSSLGPSPSGRELRGVVRDIGAKGHVEIAWDNGTTTCETPRSVFMKTVGPDTAP